MKTEDVVVGEMHSLAQGTSYGTYEVPRQGSLVWEGVLSQMLRNTEPV